MWRFQPTNFCDNAVCVDFSNEMTCCRTDIPNNLDLVCNQTVSQCAIDSDGDAMSDFSAEEIRQIDIMCLDSHETDNDPDNFENELKQ